MACDMREDCRVADEFLDTGKTLVLHMLQMPVCPWLLLLYSLPKQGGSARVGIWRKMKKSGALPFKASAYLLPNRPELFERFQWLAQQVQDAGGEATVALVSELEGISHDEMVRQFNEARAAAYAELIPPLKRADCPTTEGCG